MDKTDKEVKNLKKLTAEAYTKNLGAHWDKINPETSGLDKEIKTKSDRLVEAIEDLKQKNKRIKKELKI